MKRISLFIAAPQYEQFQELARAQGRPYAELIREALETYLKAHAARPRPPRRKAAKKGKGALK